MSILIVMSLIGVSAVLAAGIFIMARGKKDSALLSNKLMRARILLQFIAILLIVIALLYANQ